MRYWWLAWWQARRYSLLASMTCRRYSSAGIRNGTPRTSLGGPGMWAGHPPGQLHRESARLPAEEQILQHFSRGSPVVIAPLWRSA